MDHFPLLRLPNEVLYPIIDCIDPFDIVNFSLTSKAINLLCVKAIVVHKGQIIVNGSLDFRGCYRREMLDRLLDTIADICINNHEGAYATDCRIEGFDLDGAYLEDGGEENDIIMSNRSIQSICLAMIKEFMDAHERIVRRKLQSVACFPESRVDDYIRQIRNGEVGHLIGVLLILLRNVRTLTLINCTCHANTFRQVIEDLSCTWTLPNGSSNEWRPLSRLSEVSVRGSREADDEYQQQDLWMLYSLARFPQVSRLTGADLFSEMSQINGGGRLMNAQVRLERLSLHGSGLDAANVSKFISQLTRLKSFKLSVSHESENVYRGAPQIIEALVKSAGNTLEFLDFIYGDHERRIPAETTQCPSLMGLNALKDAVLDWRLFRPPLQEHLDCNEDTGLPLIPAKSPAQKPLYEVLPQSIETVVLNGKIYGQNIAMLLDGLAADGSCRLPQLTTVTFGYWRERPRSQDREAMEVSKAWCRDIGVDLLYA